MLYQPEGDFAGVATLFVLVLLFDAADVLPTPLINNQAARTTTLHRSVSKTAGRTAPVEPLENCGLWITDCGLRNAVNPQSAIRNPQCRRALIIPRWASRCPRN